MKNPKIKVYENNFLQNIGVRYPTSNGRIEGELYKKPEDFIVREIKKNGKFCSVDKRSLNSPKHCKPYVHAVLVKKNISTWEACDVFARRNSLGYLDDVSFCGLKDTFGLTSQLVCFKNKLNLHLKQTRFRNFFLKDFSCSNRKLGIGDHKGNNFTIKIRNVSNNKENIKALQSFKSTIKKGLPNFYGPQRFGIRQCNHLFGKLLLKKKYEEFLFNFLTYSKNESIETINARKCIRDNFGNWQKCIEVTKNNSELKDEKNLLNELIEHGDVLQAIKNLSISNFFLVAYSSYLFNLVLSSYLKSNLRKKKISKLGKNSKLDKFERLLYKPILEKENVSLKDFNTCDFEIFGHPRNSFFYPKNFNYLFDSKNLIVDFDLDKGQYASLVLESFVNSKNRKLC